MSFNKRAIPKWVALLVSGGFALATTASLATPAQADVDDFFFERFDAQLTLGNADGQAWLGIQEHLVAHFPDYNQNRGIVRYLPDWYGDLPLATELVDASGSHEGTVVESYRDGDAFVVQLAVPEGEYVTGIQNYDIYYTQEDVVRLVDPADPDGQQELYWDVNGTGWAQSFKQLTATISLEPSLWDKAIESSFSCYQGQYGESTPCEISPLNVNYGLAFMVQATDLAPGETVTVALAFEPNTFVIPTRNYWDSIWPWLQLIGAGLAIIASAVALWFRLRYLRSAPGRPTIIAEYQPPKDLALSTAAALMQKLPALPSAMLLDLAVSGEAKLIQTGKQKWALELVDGELNERHAEFFQVLFGSQPKLGERFDLGKPSSRRIKRIAGYGETLNRQLRTDGLVVQPRVEQRILIGVLGAIAGAGSFGASLLALINHYEHPLVFGLLLGGILLAVLPGLLVAARPLSSEGAELRDALKGLKVYIEWAEKDRLAFLQSPKGAERAITDRGEILRLYEKLLPWATVLGLGKEWSRTLEPYYQDQSPVWIVGAYPGSFHNTYSAFAAGANNSFASSSGGSSGGGSAGGGGGGGGGGGI